MRDEEGQGSGVIESGAGAGAGAGKGLRLGRGDGRSDVSVTRSQQPDLGTENRPSSFPVSVHFKLIIKTLPVRFQPTHN